MTGVPELLAPAGDWSALRAAVANGADAVYFGLEGFNARRRAANFTRDTLGEVVDWLHDHNLRGYVTLNTLAFSAELPAVAEYLAAIAAAGADAVIVQDLGVVRLARALAPTLPVHASTQMTQTEPEGIAALGALGVSRVIVARELSLDELRTIRAATDMPLEVFVHGALCLSYSGQCLASEALFGRSANRGECAQVCRLPFDLVVDGVVRDDPQRRHVLSPRDLAAVERVGDLAALGVAALKIEGRLKSAAYVAAATRVYRAALDAAAEGRPVAPTDEQHVELAQGFTRGFSRGYLDGVNHAGLVDGRSPKARGLHIGIVHAVDRGGVTIVPVAGAEAVALRPGDGVVFADERADGREQGGRVYSVTPAARPRGAVVATFGRDDVALGAIRAGSAVWKTDDPVVRQRLEATFSRDVVVRRVAVSATVEAREGAPLRLELRDAEGRAAVATGAAPLERATRHALTAELLREQLGRLGDTPYELAAVTLRGVDGPCASVPVMVPKSVLNAMRRAVVGELLAARRAAARHAVVAGDVLAQLRGPRPAVVAEAPAQVAVLVRTAAQLEAVCAAPVAARPALVYVDPLAGLDAAAAVGRVRAAGLAVGVATPRVLMPGEAEHVEGLLALRPDVVLVRTLGALERCGGRGVMCVADASLNVVNELAAGVVRGRGAARVTIGTDAAAAQVCDVLAAADAAACEVIVHQHVPLMVLRHCLWAARLADAVDCTDCGAPCAAHELRLRDRRGVAHPVRRDATGRSTLFHAVAQSGVEHSGACRAAGARWLRIELLDESRDEAAALVAAYADVARGALTARGGWEAVRVASRAGLLRGTWAAGGGGAD